MVSSMNVTRKEYKVSFTVRGQDKEVKRYAENAEILEREMLDTFKRVYKQEEVSNLTITLASSDIKDSSNNSIAPSASKEVKPMVTKSPKIAVSTKEDKLVSYVESTPRVSPVERKAGQQNRMNAIDRYSKTGYSDEQKPVKPTLSIVKKVTSVKTPVKQSKQTLPVAKPTTKQSPVKQVKSVVTKKSNTPLKPIEKTNTALQVVKEKKQSTLLDHSVVGDVYSYTEFVQAWVFDNLPDTPQLPDSTKFSYGLVYTVVRDECKKAYKNRKHLDDLTVRDCFRLLENYAKNNPKSVLAPYYKKVSTSQDRSNRAYVDLACRFHWVMCSYLTKLDARVAVLQEQEVARAKQLQAKQKQLAVKDKVRAEALRASEKQAQEKLAIKNKAIAEKNKAKANTTLRLQASKSKTKTGKK